MKTIGSSRTKSILFLALALLFLAAALLVTGVSYLAPGSYPRLWHGYYTLLVSDGRGLGDVQHRLMGAGLTVMSAQNTLVRFNDFSSERTVAVSKLPERFVSVDPRYDTFMKEIGGYFHQGRWNIFYVESGAPLPLVYFKIARALSGMPWRIADFVWERALMCLVLWALVSASVFVRMRRSAAVRYALLVGAAFSLSAAMSGDYVGTLAASLVFLAWSAVVDLGHPMLRYYLQFRLLERGRIAPIAAAVLAALFAASVLSGIEPRLAGFLARMALTVALLSASLVVYELSAHQHRQHRLFFPLWISDGRRSAAYIIPRLAETIWIAVVLFVSPVIAYMSWGADVEIPAPVVYPGVALNTWSGLHRMWEDGAQPGLPDLADYVAHRAFQAGLPYGLRYSFPIPNERVQETRYRREGNRIVSHLAVVKVFTDEWFHGILSDGNGVVRMLEEQHQAVLPTKRRIYDLGYPISFVPVFWLVTFALLLPALFLRRGRGFDTIRRSSTTVTVLAEEAQRTLNLPPPRLRSREHAYALVERKDLISEGE